MMCLRKSVFVLLLSLLFLSSGFSLEESDVIRLRENLKTALQLLNQNQESLKILGQKIDQTEQKLKSSLKLSEQQQKDLELQQKEMQKLQEIRQNLLSYSLKLEAQLKELEQDNKELRNSLEVASQSLETDKWLYGLGGLGIGLLVGLIWSATN